MFELACQALRFRGRATQRSVLKEVKIKRTAAICAILTRLKHASMSRGGRPAQLLWRAAP